MKTESLTTTRPELKSKVLSALADGVNGFRCRIDADRCRELLATARTWTPKQWRAIAKELKIAK